VEKAAARTTERRRRGRDGWDNVDTRKRGGGGIRDKHKEERRMSRGQVALVEVGLELQKYRHAIFLEQRK
jgi:hypothetical protein